MPILRVGKVTSVQRPSGKVVVYYEDTKNTSMPLSLLSVNGECALPSVGDRVLCLHMENGASKGFVLGTYYGGSNRPAASAVPTDTLLKRIERIENELGLTHEL